MLWESFRTGDKEAFAQLFRVNYGALFLYGSKFTADKDLLEDCIQELFIEIWQSRQKAPVNSVRAYLLKALKYKLLKALRRTGAQLRLEDNGEILFEWGHDTMLIMEQEKAEKKKRVIEALSRLSNRQKEIVYLKYYQDLSYEEVSEIMNINYQAARNLLYQAIRSLKQLLSLGLTLFLFLS
jgi:RNA polymerase sigma-70 factor (ECF subfamily)